MNKQTLIAIVVAALVVVGVLAYYLIADQISSSRITDFDACVASGRPVMEIYPAQCSVDGKIFVQDVPPISGSY